MIFIYKSITKYEFVNDYIKETFENRKEYYYLGFQSADYLITKIIYNYLVKYNQEISFCCDFTLLQKIVKKLTSKEYFKMKFSNFDEKYIYSLIGAIISDNYSAVEDVINELFGIEFYLLTIYKKENNKFIFIRDYLKKNNYTLTTSFSFSDRIECTCFIVELNHYFSNFSNTMLEAKYLVLEEIYTYLLDNKLYYNIDEIIEGYNVSNSSIKLNELYEKNYINKPNYFIVEHDQFKNVKYEVRCSVAGLSFYSIKFHDDKDIAKNQAAYSMIEMIRIQNNT